MNELTKWDNDGALLRAAREIYSDKEYGSPWENQFIARCNISLRTFKRWVGGAKLPGPVRAMIIAHSRCCKYGVPY